MAMTINGPLGNACLRKGRCSFEIVGVSLGATKEEVFFHILTSSMNGRAISTFLNGVQDDFSL